MKQKGESCSKEAATLSGIEVKPYYTPEDMKDGALSPPGEYPFTRGPFPTMYRERLWTMRQVAGFGCPEDANKRHRFLLEQGQTGLSLVFDMPTIQGFDSDHSQARGEVGRVGVAIDTLADMESLLEGIPMEKVSASMTTNAPASILLAMYLAVAEKRHIDLGELRGTLQNDILKEYLAQKSYIFPPRPSMRLITDIFAFCSEHVPRWNTISISGYHIREAGGTALQELAFTLANGICYVEAGLEEGLKVDAFAPRLSFFFSVHNDFFEEVAKFRAARRMWANIMRERFKAREPRSWKLRFHVQTSGTSLPSQQPINNVARVTLQALAAVLGGAQSLHTNAFDEAIAIPSEESATIALRTQQIIAHESRVAQVADPLGGSYFLEALTNEMEKMAWQYIEKIDSMGGMLRAIELGFPQREITESSHRHQKAIEEGKEVIVGVNKYQGPLPSIGSGEQLFHLEPGVEERQLQRLSQIKAQRDGQKVHKALDALREASLKKTNLMPFILEAVKAYCTLGEIVGLFKEVFGEYREEAIF